MSYILGPDVVKYACTCNLLKSIPYLYFCRHCSQLRCSFCVSHEVDTIFCGKCSENIPSSEARVRKNKCGNCYTCPICKQELSIRIASSKAPTNTEDAKATPKKMYYLSCPFCRWSSRDVGIPDQPTATGGWPERENVNINRLQELVDMYKAIVIAQRQQQEKDKKKQRGKYLSYTERTGVTAAALRKRIGLPPDFTHPMLKNKPKIPEPAKGKVEVDELPDELFSDHINLTEITTINQRLLQPESQPVTVDKLFPLHKQLYIKRSLRCRCCEHNVSKPEFNPNSVKFKIQLFAYYHIPEIRILTVEPLRAAKPCELILKFTNPTQHQTVISILEMIFDDLQPDKEEPVALETAEVLEQKLLIQESKQPTSLSTLPLASSQPSSLMASTRSPSLTIVPREVNEELNCDIEIPFSTFILPPRDDAAEYDDSGDTHNIQDDPKLVKWRKSNKAFIRLKVTPKADLQINSNVVCGFVMQHLYTNTIASKIENREPHKYDHKIKIFMHLGHIVGSD